MSKGGSDSWGFVITLLVALAVVRSAHALERYADFSKSDTRKITHTATGLIYMLTWLCYSDSAAAPFIAATVPGLMAVQMTLVGLGILKDEKIVAGMTRHGRPSELLGGPLIYALVHVVWTVVWWRRSPCALVSLAALCGGDGLAGIFGPRMGHLLGPLPHNKDKTWVGSLACLVGSFGACLPLLAIFASRGMLPGLWDWGHIIWVSLTVSLAAAAAESLPVKEFDNLLVPMAATMAVMFTA